MLQMVRHFSARKIVHFGRLARTLESEAGLGKLLDEMSSIDTGCAMKAL